MKKIFLSLFLFFISISVFSLESFGSVEESEKSKIFSFNSKENTLTYPNCTKVKVLFDDVNVHSYPSSDSPVVFKTDSSRVVYAMGYSDKKVVIDGYEGYWVQVSDGFYRPDSKSFWIFSKYIDVNPKYDVVKLDCKVENNILKLASSTQANIDKFYNYSF